MDWLFFHHFNRAGIPHAITTRHHGVSPKPFDSLNLSFSTGDSEQNVLKNRALMASYPGWSGFRFHFARQVHGNYIIRTARSEAETARVDADGLISRDPQAMAGILVADCFPVLLADRKGTTVAAVHAGRRGIEQGIIQGVIQAFTCEIGIPVQEIMVGVGPGIRTHAYPVDDATARHFSVSTGSEHLHYKTQSGSVLLDLRGTIHRILLQSGITQHNIEHLRICTAQNDDRFFSFRSSGGQTGRFAALIAPVSPEKISRHGSGEQVSV